MKGDAAIIEVALNESVTPAQHRLVPRSPQECAADARRCADAGASIAHWHAIDAEGVQRLGDLGLYAQALDLMDGCLLAYPSYPTDVPETVDARLGHCLALHEHHGMQVAPIDVATVNLVLADAEGRATGPFESRGGFEVIGNSMPFVAAALARYAEVGLAPTLASFDLGSTRAIGALALAGLVPEPLLCKIFLWQSPMIGPVPSTDALDLHLAQLPAGLDLEWLVVPYGMTDPAGFEQIARAALERGGGVRIGIGDNLIAFPDKSNAQLVDLVRSWADEAGRPVAGGDEVRQRMGLNATSCAPPL